MPIDRNALTAQQRLAISRRALVNQIHGGTPPDLAVPQGPQALLDGQPGWLHNFEWARLGRKVVERWWRRHPANAATQLARPLLDRYAREQPGKLVAVAAATGALVVLVKPWRLLSVTAVVAAVLKSSDVADMVTTLMQKNSTHRKDEK